MKKKLSCNSIGIIIILLVFGCSFKSKKNKLTKNEPVLRGIHIKAAVFNKDSLKYDYPDQKMFKMFNKWNIKLIRCNFNHDFPKIENDQFDYQDFFKAYKNNLIGLDSVMRLAALYNIKVAVVASRSVHRHTNSDLFVKNLIIFWKYFMEKYGEYENIYGLDLLNEPETEFEKNNWNSYILPQLLKIIRNYNKKIKLIIEPYKWASPDDFDNLKPIDDPNVIYSFHYYVPHAYTYQGTKNYVKGTKYPGLLQRFPRGLHREFNKSRLLDYLQPVLDFREKYNVEVYAGEVGVVRWAPGGDQWLNDILTLFEEHNITWTYHSFFSEWNGWNPTILPETKNQRLPYQTDTTSRLRLLKSFWSLN